MEIWEAQSAIRPFLSNEDTSLKFRIQVMANATNAERIAEALHHEADSPADVLLARVRQIVTKLIDQEIGGGAEQIGNRILRHRLDWQKRISHSLHDVTGLASTIIFEGTPRSETLELSLDAHPVSPRDAPHASLPLTAYATLEPTGDVPLDPLPPTREAKRAVLARFTEEAIRREVTLHAYWYDPDGTGAILKHRLSEALAQSG